MKHPPKSDPNVVDVDVEQAVQTVSSAMKVIHRSCRIRINKIGTKINCLANKSPFFFFFSSPYILYAKPQTTHKARKVHGDVIEFYIRHTEMFQKKKKIIIK